MAETLDILEQCDYTKCLLSFGDTVIHHLTCVLVVDPNIESISMCDLEASDEPVMFHEDLQSGISILLQKGQRDKTYA